MTISPGVTGTSLPGTSLATTRPADADPDRDPMTAIVGLAARFPVRGNGVAEPGPGLASADMTPTETAALIEEVARYVSADDIEAAFHQGRIVSAATGVSVVETTLMLLRGGLVFLDLSSSPLDVRLPPDADESVGWSRWRRDDAGGYEIEDAAAGEWVAVAGTRIARGTSSADVLSGSWVRESGYVLGSTSIAREETLTLGADGTIGTRGATVTTFDGWAPHYRPQTSTSRWSSADDAFVDADGRTVPDRYRLLDDGLTVEVTRGDGAVRRRLGYALHEGFVLDGRAYRRPVPTPDPVAPGPIDVAGHGRDGAAWLSALGDAVQDADEEAAARKRRDSAPDRPSADASDTDAT